MKKEDAVLSVATEETYNSWATQINFRYEEYKVIFRSKAKDTLFFKAAKEIYELTIKDREALPWKKFFGEVVKFCKKQTSEQNKKQKNLEKDARDHFLSNLGPDELENGGTEFLFDIGGESARQVTAC